MSKLTKIVSIALISASSFTLAVESAFSLSKNINTGIANYSITGPTGGGVDKSSGSNLTTPSGSFLANSGTSQWIGPLASANFVGIVDSPSYAPAGNYTYNTVLDLTGLDLSAVSFGSLLVVSDNDFTSLSLTNSNGTTSLLSSLPGNNNDFSNFLSYDLSSTPLVASLVAGQNTFSFVVTNPSLPGASNSTLPSAFISGANPTAFRAEFALNNLQPVPFEFNPAVGVLLVGGYFVGQRFLRSKKS